MKRLSLLLLIIFPIYACAPEIGSPRWCDQMDAKAKGDWSVNEATDYAKHCLFE